MEGVEESQCNARGADAAGHGGFVRPALTTRVVAAGALALAAGLVLRLWMLHWLFEVNGDSLVYGGIAKNLLLHGRYALTAGNGEVYPTLLRLPGYPFFLAACFKVFGIEDYFAVCCVQIVLELAGCVLLADFARRAARAVRPGDEIFARRAGWATLWLAVLCPFTASYTAAPMAEAPTLFAIALAMWAMALFCERPHFDWRGWSTALTFTFAATWAALLRPDGALVAVAFVPVMVAGARSREPKDSARPVLVGARMAVVCALVALAPFAAWTARNWRVFHVFQPLAPRMATDPGETPQPGFERWVATWCLDFNSTYDIYWNVPDEPLDVGKLPARAFDFDAQRAETAAVAGEYNAAGYNLTPAVDAGFARLAQERIAAHPVRYYVWLPLGRVADMWLRPRVENLPIDLDWWVYGHHRAETRFSWFHVALNMAYLLLAVVGLWLRPKFWKTLLAYMLLRSALLLTVNAPEARYTLECFPMLFALSGVALAAGMNSRLLRRG
jgi:Dolichyl-phosphate-mannose-protein mannosyltransferase